MINDEILHKWINEQLTEEELKAFKLRPEYDSLATLYKNTEWLSAPTFDKEAMLAEILQKGKIKSIAPKTGRRVFMSNWIKYAAAASLILIAGWFLFLNNSTTVYEVAKGESKEGTLPDQSIFNLNAESALSFNKKTWSQKRELELNGEAFFSVKSGSTFTVKTPTGNVQVLGTKFNVRSRGNIFDVKCTHGKVAVLKTDGTLITELEPFEAVRIKKGKTPDKYQIVEEENIGWTKGMTKLRKVTLGEAIAELERRLNVNIKTEGIDLSEIINCNFQHKDLELALRTVLSPLDIDFEIKDTEVILKNK